MAVTLSITLAQSTQDVANNRTLVYAYVYAHSTNGSYNNNSKPGSLTLDGETYSFSHSFAKNTTTLLYSVSKWCSHDSVGKKTVSASASFTTGVSSGTIYASNSLALTTIARATVPTLSTANVGLGDSVTINLPRKSTAFTHDVTYSIGSAKGTIATGVATSCEWTPPPELADQIPGSTQGSVTITVTTKSGTTTIGTKTIALTVTVPDTEEYNPTLSIEVTDAAGYKDKYGYYLVGYSRYKVTITEATMHGATITSRITTMNGASFATLNPESGVLSSVENNTVTCTITDSRGRSATVTVGNLPTRTYTRPQITNAATPIRCLQNGTAYEDGDYIKASMEFTYDSIGGKNTITAKVKARPRTSAEYTTEATIINGGNVILVGDHNYTYYVTYEVVDSLGQLDSITYQLNTHDAVISSKLGYKLAIGKAAELGTKDKPVFESAWHTVLPTVEAASVTSQKTDTGETTATTLSVGNIDMTITDEEYDELFSLLGGVLRLIDFIYPVGAVIASVNPDFDPNKIYQTHTWERFAKGQTLVGVDEDDADFASAGKTGGEKTHKLTINEMPSHRHSLRLLHGSNASSASVLNWTGGVTTGWQDYEYACNTTGGGGAHNNLQPYVTVYYWKRIS